MSSPNPNDILSAYFDREAAPSEEAAAKALAEGSSEAAREIRDYGRLSRLLQGLPRVPAPPEFAATVMQRAERESLIPLDAAALRPAAERAGVGGFVRRQWMLVVASSISLVAGLLIAVMIWPHGVDARHPRAVEGFATAPRGERRGEPTVTSLILTAPKTDRALNAPKPSSAMLAKAATPTPAAKQAPAKSREATLMLPANLKTAHVGDVIDALEQDGPQVAVVRLTVVNQVEGLDGVQSLLVRNTIRTLQNADEISRLRQQFGAGKSTEVPKSAVQQAPGELICVYVEGSREEMLGVFNDLQNESHIQAAELTNTISYSALEEFARPAVPRQSAERTATNEQAAKGFVAQAPAKPTGSQVAVSLPASTVNKILQAGQRSGTVRGNSSASAIVQQTPAPLFQAAPKLDSAQQSDAKANEPVDKQLVARRAPHTHPASKSGPSLSDQWLKESRLKESQEVAGDQKSFQIFFVLTDQSQAPAAPTASDAAKSAAAPAKPTAAAPAKKPAPSETSGKPAPKTGP